MQKRYYAKLKHNTGIEVEGNTQAEREANGRKILAEQILDGTKDIVIEGVDDEVTDEMVAEAEAQAGI